MAEENTTTAATAKAREEKLAKVHSVEKVYAKVAGANKEITLDARLADGTKIPVTTKTFGREENHFEFEEPKEKAEAVEGE